MPRQREDHYGRSYSSARSRPNNVHDSCQEQYEQLRNAYKSQQENYDNLKSMYEALRREKNDQTDQIQRLRRGIRQKETQIIEQRNRIYDKVNEEQEDWKARVKQRYHAEVREMKDEILEWRQTARGLEDQLAKLYEQGYRDGLEKYESYLKSEEERKEGIREKLSKPPDIESLPDTDNM